MDDNDFDLECTECGAIFNAGENMTEDGQNVICPECGDVSVDDECPD